MADTSVVLFDSTMTGAPTLGGVAGNLISVLDACLVDGFGLKTVDSLVIAGGVATATISTGHSARQDVVVLVAGATVTGGTINGRQKVVSTTTNTVVFDATGIPDQTATGTITLKLAPAGWTKAFSGTNLAAYKSGNVAATGLYVRFDDTGTTNARVVGYEAMTDVNTGMGAFPTAAQLSGGHYWAKANNTTGTRKWWVVADDRFVYLGVARHATYVDDYEIYAFGDFVSRKSADGYGFALFGWTVDRASAAPVPSGNHVVYKQSSPQNSVILARSYTQLGAAVAGFCEWGGSSGSPEASGAGTRQYPNGPDNGLLLEKPQIVEGTALCNRGMNPGAYVSSQAVLSNISNDSLITDVPGISGRKLAWKILGSSSSRGGFALDITGPWR